MQFKDKYDSFVQMSGYDYSTGNKLAEKSGNLAGSPEIVSKISEDVDNLEKMDYSPEDFVGKVSDFEERIVEESSGHGRTVITHYNIELEDRNGDKKEAESLEEVSDLVEQGYEGISSAYAHYISAESNSAPEEGHMVRDFKASVKYKAPGQNGVKEFPARLFSTVEINRPYEEEYQEIVRSMKDLFPEGR